jgi:hypothetical protein
MAAAAPLSAADPVLWYRHAAQKWGDALPVGNGRLGGMVFGEIAKEHIQLNEDTVWNGRKRDRINPEALKALPEVQADRLGLSGVRRMTHSALSAGHFGIELHTVVNLERGSFWLWVPISEIPRRVAKGLL